MLYQLRKVVLGWMLETVCRTPSGDWETTRQLHIFRRGQQYHAYTHGPAPKWVASGDFLHCARQIRTLRPRSI